MTDLAVTLPGLALKKSDYARLRVFWLRSGIRSLL